MDKPTTEPIELNAMQELSAFTGAEDQGPLAGVYIDTERRLAMASNGAWGIVVPLPSVAEDQLALFVNTLDVRPAQSCVINADSLKEAIGLAGIVRLGMTAEKIALFKANDGGEFVLTCDPVIGKGFPDFSKLAVDAPHCFRLNPKFVEAIGKYAVKFGEAVEFQMQQPTDVDPTPTVQVRIKLKGDFGTVKAVAAQMK